MKPAPQSPTQIIGIALALVCLSLSVLTVPAQARAFHQDDAEPLPWVDLNVVSQSVSNNAVPYALPSGTKAAHSDPAVHTDYGLTCTWRITCGGVKAQMRWPTTGSCWNDAPPRMPLVVMLHGFGFNYRDYDYLQTHLARNGMLSASLGLVANLESVPYHQGVADDAETFLDSACFQEHFLDNFSQSNPFDGARTALVGHSRGGESVRYLANNLQDRSDFNVRSVVSLAPTRSTPTTLFGTLTPSHMVLFGASDEDVSNGGVFTSHDLAGYNEVSTPLSLDLERSMKLLSTGNHRFFTDYGLGYAPVQWHATQGYVNAFLRKWLFGDLQFYGGYVRGDLVPGDFGPPVFSQFSSGVARRVIDSFQDLNVSPSTIGGSVSTYGVGDIDAVLASSLDDTPHDGRVLTWTPIVNNAYVAWNLPQGQRDATDYLYLSLRIGLLEGSGPVTGRLWIKNGNSFAWVDLADYGGVAEPTSMCTEKLNKSCLLHEDQAHMRTLRVPLSAFGDHDDIQTVYLQFLSGAIGDTFMVDNLEFADTLGILF